LALCVFDELWRRNDVLPRRRGFNRAHRRWQLGAAISLDHEITATRAYKLILKSIAEITGHRGTGSCILVTSLSLEELDRKSSEFCQDDRAALVAAGVLKEKEQQSGPGCMDVARRSLPAPLLTARRKLDDWLGSLR
jgi:hypothetical protein